MEIQEIQEKKKTLLKEMSDLVSKFQKETNVCINDIEYNHIQVFGSTSEVMIINNITIGL